MYEVVDVVRGLPRWRWVGLAGFLLINDKNFLSFIIDFIYLSMKMIGGPLKILLYLYIHIYIFNLKNVLRLMGLQMIKNLYNLSINTWL